MTPSFNLTPTLSGKLVKLEAMTLEHVPALAALGIAHARDYVLTSVPSSLESAQAYVQNALQAREHRNQMPFVTIDQNEQAVVGSTRFGALEFWPWPKGHTLERHDGTPDALEIGWTWLTPQAQRTGINTEAKYLMLEHAFEVLQVRRVTLKTDARNDRSRNAILRIGASFEGVLRSHVPASDGGVRDSAYYSILENEWPEVKAKLEQMQARH